MLPTSPRGSGRAGLWVLGQQCRRLHDLAGLAIAALRNVDLGQAFCHRVIAARVQALDGGDLAADHIAPR